MNEKYVCPKCQWDITQELLDTPVDTTGMEYEMDCPRCDATLKIEIECTLYYNVSLDLGFLEKEKITITKGNREKKDGAILGFLQRLDRDEEGEQ